MADATEWQVSEEIHVPPKDARAVALEPGQRIRITTPRGYQASDFFAFNADDTDEWLSPHHSWVWSTYMRPREGQTFLTNRRNPILEFVEDGANGVHDMYLAPCDEARFRQLGSDQKIGCAELMVKAMSKLGYDVKVGPLDINLFTATKANEDQILESDPNPVEPGSYAIVE